MFGLHANADLTFRTLQARDRLQLFRDTRPAESSRKAGASREDVVDKMAEDLLAKAGAAIACVDGRSRLVSRGLHSLLLTSAMGWTEHAWGLAMPSPCGRSCCLSCVVADGL